MTDTASLEIRVRSLEVESADRRLKSLENQGKRTERATDGLTRAFTRLVAPLTAAVSVSQGLEKIVGVTREFDVLNAGLLTATKSAEGAALAFEALEQFATDTPYGLQQATEGFTKLVNLGLTPSERALTSYGNTASAMGKSLNQMIEAVADASTMEFERLKEFGIKARQEADTVSFTFQGVTTTVGKNAAEIESYLMALGENQFAGAMATRMDSLDGAIANLEDSWDALFRSISSAGVGDAIEASVRQATDAIEELTDMIVSGQMVAGLSANLNRWEAWVEDVTRTIELVGDILDSEGSAWGNSTDKNVALMVEAFSNFPENVRAFIQIMTVELASQLDKGVALARSFKESIKAIFTDDTQANVNARLEAEIARIDQVRGESIDSILRERETALESYDAQMAKAAELRAEYEKDKEARRALTEDRLAQFKVEAEEREKTLSKTEETAQKKRTEEFQRLVEDLMSEEEAIAASYERRKAIIEANTESGSTARQNLMDRLEKDRQQEMDHLLGIEDMYSRRTRLAVSVAELEKSGWNDAQKAAAEYQAQMELLWEAQMVGVINEQQHEEAVNRVTEAYNKQRDKMENTYFDLEELGKQAARNVQDAFADFLFDPFSEGLDGMLLGFVNVVRRMAAEAAAAQLAQSLFGSSGGGGGWLGAIATGVSAYFGGGSTAASSMAQGATQAGYSNLASWTPGRAAGGPTTPGQLYEVNERNPEVFRQGGKDFLISTKAGEVTPLREHTGGGGDINIELTVNVDSSGAEVSTDVSGDTQRDANELANLMKQVSVKTMQDESRPGGILWRLQQSRRQ